MTEHDKQQLAELGGFPVWRLLMGLFAAHERLLLADVAGAAGDRDALAATRRYQVFRYVREFLEAQPAAAETALADMKAITDAWGNVPPSIDELFHARWGQPNDDNATERTS